MGMQIKLPGYGAPYPMIIQHTRLISKQKMPSVVRAVAIGSAGDRTFIAAACQDKKLHILDARLREIQSVEFSQWVRCVAMGDLHNNGSMSIVAGSGDKSVHLYELQGETFVEKHIFQFNDFVNTCEVADYDGDGKLDIIVGSWDKTLKIFDGQTYAIKHEWTFPREVDMIRSADFNNDGKLEIGVILKGGTFLMLDGTTKQELWRFVKEKDFAGIEISSFDVSGIPYTIIGGADQKLYFFDTKGQLLHTITVGDRITSIRAGDIDGGNHNELLVGVGQNKLICYEIKHNDLLSLDVKWSIRTTGVINTINIADVNEDKKNEIIFAGYDGFVNVHQDFFYGEKTALTQNAPEQVVEEIKTIAEVKAEEPLKETQRAIDSATISTPVAASITAPVSAPIPISTPVLFPKDNESAVSASDESRQDLNSTNPPITPDAPRDDERTTKISTEPVSPTKSEDSIKNESARGDTLGTANTAAELKIKSELVESVPTPISTTESKSVLDSTTTTNSAVVQSIQLSDSNTPAQIIKDEPTIESKPETSPTTTPAQINKDEPTIESNPETSFTTTPAQINKDEPKIESKPETAGTTTPEPISEINSEPLEDILEETNIESEEKVPNVPKKQTKKKSSKKTSNN